LRKLANKANALQSIINRDLTLKYTPRLRFVLDGSVAKGDHVLDILSHLDIPKDNSSESPT
jgi:ribosome-binding factor A